MSLSECTLCFETILVVLVAISMQAPSGAMVDEVLEILGRNLKKLATARDLPRLVGHITLEDNGDRVFVGSNGGVLQFLTELHQRCGGDPGASPKSVPDQSDIVRNYIDSGLRLPVVMFVLHCTNQNIIAPALVRMKHEMARNGYQTKDGGIWRIGICLNGKETTVTHVRDEVDVRGAFSFGETFQRLIVSFF